MIKAKPGNSKVLFYVVLALWCITYSGTNSDAEADEILIAVASNFYNPLREIARSFEKETGHKVQVVAGSTGKLYAQIVNGAPFELLLAADSRRPRLLEKGGWAVPGTRFTYALGKITLWSPNPTAISKDGESTLRKRNFAHLAMANPITAPYGKAALQTLQKLGLWSKVQPLVVQGENIGQTFQFVASQNAELGFVALSQVLDPKNHQKGTRWDVPDRFYDSLEQDLVILKNAENNPAVKTFWKFLKNKHAKRIIKKYGYGLP